MANVPEHIETLRANAKEVRRLANLGAGIADVRVARLYYFERLGPLTVRLGNDQRVDPEAPAHPPPIR